MKRLLSLLLALACTVTLCGCEKLPGEKRQMYFNAAVLELNEGSVKVKCTDGFDSGISLNEELFVSTDVVAANGVPDMVVGDHIRVVFNGEIMESDPLQLGSVFAIYLLVADGEAIPNKS